MIHIIGLSGGETNRYITKLMSRLIEMAGNFRDGPYYALSLSSGNMH